MLKQITILTSLIILATSTASATILFSPSVTSMNQKISDNGATADAKMTLVDLRLGYVTSFGLYLGGLYSIQDREILNSSSDSYFGASVGYYNSGFLFVGSYYLYGERDLTSGNGKYAGAKGYQLDFSYSVPITSTISIGPQLTFHNVKYDDFENANGISTTTDYSFSGMTPYFNLTFVF